MFRRTVPTNAMSVVYLMYGGGATHEGTASKLGIGKITLPVVVNEVDS